MAKTRPFFNGFVLSMVTKSPKTLSFSQHLGHEREQNVAKTPSFRHFLQSFFLVYFLAKTRCFSRVSENSSNKNWQKLGLFHVFMFSMVTKSPKTLSFSQHLGHEGVLAAFCKASSSTFD